MKHPTNFIKIVLLFIEKLLAGRRTERTKIDRNKRKKGKTQAHEEDETNGHTYTPFL